MTICQKLLSTIATSQNETEKTMLNETIHLWTEMINAKNQLEQQQKEKEHKNYQLQPEDKPVVPADAVFARYLQIPQTLQDND
jgi:hypothetical protein